MQNSLVSKDTFDRYVSSTKDVLDPLQKFMISSGARTGGAAFLWTTLPSVGLFIVAVAVLIIDIVTRKP